MGADHECKQKEVIKIILDQLTNGKKDFRELRADVKQILQEVAALKEKARNWGAAWGFIGGIIVIVIKAIIDAATSRGGA